MITAETTKIGHTSQLSAQFTRHNVKPNDPRTDPLEKHLKCVDNGLYGRFWQSDLKIWRSVMGKACETDLPTQGRHF